MKITVPVSVIAADTDSRTISGRIVTWGEVGNTSAGKTIFAKDSIALKPVKLFIDHNMDKPIGKVLDFETTDLGIQATFKIANTQRGNDAIVEAMEGLKDGFSVGIKLTEYDNTDEGLVVKMSNLVEVSLVETPAIDSARVSEVAASDDPTHEQEGSDMTDTPELQTENEVSVEAAKVEAASARTSAPVFTAPRVDTNVTAGQYVHAQIKASQGDNDARDLIAALEIATVAENTGMVPPNYLRDIIGIIDDSRPFINSIERAPLPASGMKIFTPKLGTQAAVAQTAEGVEFESVDTVVTFQEDNIVKFAGANIINVELLDRSDPSFLDLLLRELAASYAQKTDAYAANIAAHNSGNSDGESIYQAIAKGIADSYGIMRFTPDNLLVAPSGGQDDIDFAGLLGAVDSNDRPLYAAAAVQNAAGLITQGSTNGTVAGLNMVVDPNYTGNNDGDKYGLVYPRAAMRFHESGTVQLRSNIVANGRVEIGIYGYAAVVNKYPTAFRYLTVTPPA
jgi:HK97 family phage prohead protease